jgi:hypothetical protein
MIFEPIFGEGNEIVAFLDDLGNEWTVEDTEAYWEVSGNCLEDNMYEFTQTWVGW